MKAIRSIATIATTAALVVAVSLYGVRVAHSSDHQDSPVGRRSAGRGHHRCVRLSRARQCSQRRPRDGRLSADSGGNVRKRRCTRSIPRYCTSSRSQTLSRAGLSGKTGHPIRRSGSGQGQILTMYGPAAPNEVGRPTPCQRQRDRAVQSAHYAHERPNQGICGTAQRSVLLRSRRSSSRSFRIATSPTTLTARHRRPLPRPRSTVSPLIQMAVARRRPVTSLHRTTCCKLPSNFRKRCSNPMARVGASRHLDHREHGLRGAKKDMMKNL